MNRRNVSLITVFLFICLVLSFSLMTGCATTPKGKLIQTQRSFESLLDTYNDEMDLQTDEAVKAEWRKVFPPLFERAHKAEKAYKDAVMSGLDVEAKRQLFEFVKNEIIKEFLRYNVKVKE